jgi:hypothetical protein
MRTSALLLAATTALTLAGISASATTAAKVTVTPQLVRPRTDNIARIGIRYAGKTGGFRLEKHISRTTPAGKWAILACQRNCRIQGVGIFRVAKIKPL